MMTVWDKMLSDPPASLSLLLVASLLLCKFLGSSQILVALVAGGVACYMWLSTMQSNGSEPLATETDDCSPVRHSSKFGAVRPVRRRLDKTLNRKESYTKNKSVDMTDMVIRVECAKQNLKMQDSPMYAKKVDDSILPSKCDDQLCVSGDADFQKPVQAEVVRSDDHMQSPMRSLVQFVASDHKSHQGKWLQNRQLGAPDEEDLEMFVAQVKVQSSMIDVLLEFKDPDVSRLISELRPRVAALQEKIDALVAKNQHGPATTVQPHSAILCNSMPFSAPPPWGYGQYGKVPQGQFASQREAPRDLGAFQATKKLQERDERIAMGWAMGGSGRTTPQLHVNSGLAPLVHRYPPGLGLDSWMVDSQLIAAQ